MGAPLEGRYANYFEIGFTANEVFLDFGQMDPETEALLRHTRIVVTPASAKTLKVMLEDILSDYEIKVAKIADSES